MSSPNSPVQQTLASVLPVPSAPPAPAPQLLPSCLQTWIKGTQCKDNSDSNCFCKIPNFTTYVQKCISAWAGHQAEEQGALSYLAGICAPHIAANPGIITNVPTTITLAPTPLSSNGIPVSPNNPAPSAPAAPGGQTPPAAAPQTTVSISTILTVACPSGQSAAGGVSLVTSGQAQASGSAGMAPSCMTTSVLNTAVVVPQVAFTTANSNVGLVAGTPAPAAAAPTGVKSPATNVNSPIAPAAAPGSPAAPGVSSNQPASPAGVAQPPVIAPSSPSGYTVSPSSTASVVPFTGAATRSTSGGVLLSAVFAVAGYVILA